MKINAKNIVFGLGILFLSSSCDNFLDVRPKGEVLGKELLTDRKGFENALYGTYATMRGNDLYGSNLSFYTMEIMAQYFNCPGNENVTAISAFNYYDNPAVKGIFLDIWSGMYENISYVNNILKNLGHESPSSLKFYDIYKGEALGMRAFMHFDLLRLFCEQNTQSSTRGIVYSTDFSLKPRDILPKTEVWKHIVRDLKEAEQLLDNPQLYAEATADDAFLKDQQIHFNLHAVRATLARVYLTMENTDSAYYYAHKVIEESGLSLVDKTEIAGDIIGTLSQEETIFGLYSKDLYTSTKDILYNSISFSSLDPRSDIDQTYQTNHGNDFRWNAWFALLNKQNRFIKLTDKYQLSPGTRPKGQIPGINLLRLPEMYYIVAECLLKKGDPRAENYFNDVLESRGLIPLNQRNPVEQLTVEKISEERYKELIGEGQTFFNMKRLNSDIKTISGETVAASNNIYVIHIPEEEYNYRN